jgi:hypothetical protein
LLLFLTFRAAKRRIFVCFCDAVAAHVYGGRYGGDLSPRMRGSGIKTGRLFVPFLCSEGGLPPLKKEFDFIYIIIYIIIINQETRKE